MDQRLFGVRTPAARDILSYWLALAARGRHHLALIYLVLRSRLGLALAAIRDCESPPTASASTPRAPKLAVYVLAAVGTGMTGALIYLQKARISPDAAFSVLDWTAYVIVIVVIGGIGTIEGPIIGVIVFYLMQTYLADFGTLVSHPARGARYRRDAVRASRHLGLRLGALRRHVVSRAPPADCAGRRATAALIARGAPRSVVA